MKTTYLFLIFIKDWTLHSISESTENAKRTLKEIRQNVFKIISCLMAISLLIILILTTISMIKHEGLIAFLKGGFIGACLIAIAGLVKVIILDNDKPNEAKIKPVSKRFMRGRTTLPNGREIDYIKEINEGLYGINENENFI